MTDNTELKQLAQQRAHGQMVCSAKDVLDLFAERDQLKSDNERHVEEYDKAWRHDLNDKNNLKVMADEIARLAAENAGLKTGYEAYERVNAELKAENEALRKDDIRVGLMALAAYIGPICTAAVVAAMGKGEQS